MRVVLVGGPRSGKSTLARKMGLKHYCTDPLSLVKEPLEGVEYLPEGLEWGEDSEYVATSWLGKDNAVIEGVGTVRALRKWMETNEEMPCDCILYLCDKVVERTDGQQTMAEGVETIWNEIADYYKNIATKIRITP